MRSPTCRCWRGRVDFKQKALKFKARYARQSHPCLRRARYARWEQDDGHPSACKFCRAGPRRDALLALPSGELPLPPPGRRREQRRPARRRSHRARTQTDASRSLQLANKQDRPSVQCDRRHSMLLSCLVVCASMALRHGYRHSPQASCITSCIPHGVVGRVRASRRTR